MGFIYAALLVGVFLNLWHSAYMELFAAWFQPWGFLLLSVSFAFVVKILHLRGIKGMPYWQVIIGCMLLLCTPAGMNAMMAGAIADLEFTAAQRQMYSVIFLLLVVPAFIAGAFLIDRKRLVFACR